MRRWMWPVTALIGAGVTAQAQVSAPAPARKAAPARPAGPTRPAAAKPKAAPAPALMTDEQKTLYALGLSISKSLDQFGLTPAELDIVKLALTDAAAGKPAESLNEWGPKIQELARARGEKVAAKQKAESAAYLEKAGSEPGATKTASGMIYRETRAGTGPSPKPSDTVKVNYRGTFVNGTEFDSSYARNEPAQFPLTGVIPCWTEGLQQMKVGGKATLVCPSSIAYGDQGRPGIPGGSTLIFDVELLEIAGSPK